MKWIICISSKRLKTLVFALFVLSNPILTPFCLVSIKMTKTSMLLRIARSIEWLMQNLLNRFSKIFRKNDYVQKKVFVHPPPGRPSLTTTLAEIFTVVLDGRGQIPLAVGPRQKMLAISRLFNPDPPRDTRVKHRLFPCFAWENKKFSEAENFRECKLAGGKLPKKSAWLGIEFTRFSKMTSQNPIQFLSPSFLVASRLEKEDKKLLKSMWVALFSRQKLCTCTF
jgi:hypothetical protein